MRLRVTFSKQGALRYTGHLDLHKIWERSLRRGGLPLAYSQGYHPQPKIQLAAALPLGFSSCAEVMDVWFNEEVTPATLPAMLEGCIPPGLEILRVEEADEREPSLQSQVIAAEYQVEITEANFVSGLTEKVAAVMESESVPRERRGKQYDLRPLIVELIVADKNQLFMRLTAREGATARPEELLDELGIPLEICHIERVNLIFRG